MTVVGHHAPIPSSNDIGGPPESTTLHLETDGPPGSTNLPLVTVVGHRFHYLTSSYSGVSPGSTILPREVFGKQGPLVTVVGHEVHYRTSSDSIGPPGSHNFPLLAVLGQKGPLPYLK